MYRSSKTEKQLDMFSSISGMLNGTSQKKFNDPKAWHNMFRIHVLERIDEEIFLPLFNDTKGAPNASVKVLIGMMILKEAFGWSDSDLFEHCRFNLLARSSLGLHNITDSLPVESTYYLFRKRIHNYYKETREDLIDKVFHQVTGSQVIEFKVRGGSIRMDSKLIGSNISFSTRYEIVHDILVLFYKEMIKSEPIKVSKKIVAQLKEVFQTNSNKVVYQSVGDELQVRLEHLGVLCYKLLKAYKEKDNKHYNTLKRVFEEQFNRRDGGLILVKPSEEIKSDSAQSAHDTECAYRNKDGQAPVKGYSINTTETCDEGSLNLITDIQTVPANKPDTEFVEPAVEATSSILGHKPEALHADGGFNSPDNVEYCENEDISHYFSGVAGVPGRYDLEFVSDKLIVVDTKTGKAMQAYKTKTGRWGIKTENGYRYFTDHAIKTSLLRKKIKQVPDYIRNKRNNVEATIFQLSYHTRNNKTRYRGMFSNKSWAIMRSMWINLRRIRNYIEENYANVIHMDEIMSLKKVFIQKFNLEAIFDSLIYFLERYLKPSYKYRTLMGN
jgi:hypothetical protein